MKPFKCVVNVGDLIQFDYTNWKGVKSKRKVIVQEFVFTKSKYHPEYQMFIQGYDMNKMNERTFAVKDIEAETVVILKGGSK